jgi:hypothetical protein
MGNKTSGTSRLEFSALNERYPHIEQIIYNTFPDALPAPQNDAAMRPLNVGSD